MGKLMGSRRLPSLRGERTDRTRQLSRLRLRISFAPGIDREGEMTLRRDWLYAAMAAAALTIADVSAARALSFCDIYPQRCRYSPSGRGYYYPQGQRMPEGLEPAFIERNGTGNAARGSAWGCGATEGTSRRPVSWGYPSRAAAASSALEACTRGSTGGSCRVIGCSSGVRSREEARARWPRTAHR
jgi:hypothetical protein